MAYSRLQTPDHAAYAIVRGRAVVSGLIPDPLDKSRKILQSKTLCIDPQGTIYPSGNIGIPLGSSFGHTSQPGPLKNDCNPLASWNSTDRRKTYIELHTTENRPARFCITEQNFTEKIQGEKNSVVIKKPLKKCSPENFFSDREFPPRRTARAGGRAGRGRDRTHRN
jgi:hypothetical protein